MRARPAPVGPVLDELVNPLWRKQPPMLALMPMLPATLPTRSLTTWTRRRRWRILRRRQRRVPRTPGQATFELSHSSLKALVRLDQPLVRCHQIIKPKQQTNSRLAITIKDRLSLNPLHTNMFGVRTEVPSPPERLPKTRRFQRVL